ncbi:MAG: 3-dehydroquinate synthase [Proteobacteria bacterium]|nr:3-dehydroquinate synthase [Pseudomonadota bacterium]
MQSIELELGKRSYPIFIGNNILGDFGGTLKKYTSSKQVTVVTNTTVAPLYYDAISDSLSAAGFNVSLIEMPDGEEFKSLEWAGRIFDKLVEYRADRYTPLIALGGGVVGDITGFVAATYLRGVPFIQVPTTLLAQVDSSVGGKTAVNHPMGKNLIGAFYQPKLVYTDIATLKTLDQREIRAGIAEVIKYGVIKDEELFEFLKAHADGILEGDEKGLQHIIERSCRIKASVVSADEREAGQRAILNFGHTFGHAVEAVTKYKEYKHGEAVAIGMIYAAKLAERVGLCNSDVSLRIGSLLERYGLPLEASGLAKAELMSAMKLDKKVVLGDLRFILPKKIGEVEIKNISSSTYGDMIV